VIQIKDQSFHADIPKYKLNSEKPVLTRKHTVDEISAESKKTFFFEEEKYQLTKISGIRLSLCLSLAILYKLSVQKKKVACQAIVENKMS
jgi:hypothetical protein